LISNPEIRVSRRFISDISTVILGFVFMFVILILRYIILNFNNGANNGLIIDQFKRILPIPELLYADTIGANANVPSYVLYRIIGKYCPVLYTVEQYV